MVLFRKEKKCTNDLYRSEKLKNDSLFLKRMKKSKHKQLKIVITNLKKRDRLLILEEIF